jgi:protein-S-isoprenylcysteine O-methyltransferase Ste14
VNGNIGRFAHSRRYDLAFAIPLAVVFAFSCAGNIINIARAWPRAHDSGAVLEIVNQAAAIVFYAMQLILCLTRRLPLRKTEGVWPRATAMLGANFNFALLLLPRLPLSGIWALSSAALTIGGTLASITVLFYLGRSFSIFPEGRGLVTRGPYRFIRHPLYVAEIVSMLGIMLQFKQPWSALIVFVSIVFQFRRMTYEEDVLARSFADYDAYRRNTARLIPGLY